VWTSESSVVSTLLAVFAPGATGVNYYNLDVGAPFGGMKDSGIGREFGPEGLDNYLQSQSIYASSAVIAD